MVAYPLAVLNPLGHSFMQKSLKKGVYLYLRNHSMYQLRQAAKNHQRALATEVSRILEETLRPGQVHDKGPPDAAGTDKFNVNGLYVDLSEELLAWLRPLAERNYRSLAGQVTFIVEAVLSLNEHQAGIMAATNPKPILKLKNKSRLPKSAC
jgi:hypothetical protein